MLCAALTASTAMPSAVRPAPPSDRAAAAPVWIACRTLGLPSEAWLYRQIVSFSVLCPEVLCWSRQNESWHPMGRIPVHVLPFPVSPHDGGARWWYRLRTLAQRNFYGSVGAEARHLARLMRARRPEVVLCHFGHTALRLLPVARRLGVPVVAHFHGVDISFCLRNPWYRWSLQRHLGDLAALVVVADYQREQLIRLGAEPERIHLIPCGVPVEELAPAVNVARQPCRFVTVGRLVEKKGPLETLQALAACAPEAPDGELTVIGDGPLLAASQALARELQVADRVHFLGNQPSPVVLQQLRESSVLLQHSLTSRLGDKEGWPVSVAEAMATGLPVVATRHAGITEQVRDGETGYLVAERDVATMARRMAQLARDPALRSALGRRGREVAEAHFDQRQQVRKLEQVLESVFRRVGVRAAVPAIATA
jgi:glycosyltransferase involved in cell wall biosynthesis